jgi:hypothetical protein
MSEKVIQGFFLGGRPRAPVAAVQPKAMPRPPGPPAAAFAGRPLVTQAHRAGDSFKVDPTTLGLMSSGGRPLPEAVRSKMETALGADFSAVRVHVGPQAERIGAIALTVGSDIYFAPGRYQPGTIQGQQLLGHELAHVVQQRSGRVRNPLGAGLAVVQDRALEAEADRLGQRAAARPVATQAKPGPGAVQSSASVRISPPVRGGRAAQRTKAVYIKKRRFVWNNRDEPDAEYFEEFSHWVSSFFDSLVIDLQYGVITQTAQGDTGWAGGHSELFLEYLDNKQKPQFDRIHFSHDKISIGPYSATALDWRSRLPRGSSWRVSSQQIKNALATANTLKQKFDNGELKYAQWFGTTEGWKSATTSDKVWMNCKDVTDAILMELGILHGRKASTTWYKTNSFNSPQNIAGHSDRNSINPDDKWVD